MTTTTQAKPAVKPGAKIVLTDPHRCRRQCPGGYQCVCDNAVTHTLHLCSNGMPSGVRHCVPVHVAMMQP